MTAAGTAVQSAGEAVAAAERAEAVPAQVDTAMAAQVGAGGEFDTKLNATIVEQVDPLRLRQATAELTVTSDARHLPQLVSLITGASPSPTPLNGTVAVAPGVGYGASKDGLKLVATGGLTSLGVRVALGSPASVGPAQAVCVAVDIPDVSKIGAVTPIINHDAARTAPFAWSRSTASTPVQTLVNGLNIIRFPAALHDSGFAANFASSWGKPHFATVSLSKAGGGTIDAGAEATIRHVWLEVQPKAKIVVIADRGYKSWVDGAYPDLKALGIPVTWAPDLDLFGSNPGTIFEAISEQRLHELAKENGNSVSFHGKTGGPTSGMTAEQLAAETASCRAWLRMYGYQGRIWRAAYVQNDAAQSEHPSVTEQLIGAAYSTSAGITPRDTYPIWPPINLYKLRREGIENQYTSAVNQANIDGWFNRLKVDHGVVYVFFHRINDSDQFSTRRADWDYFVGKLTAGLSEGWLEGATFEDLYYGSGGMFEQRNGVAISRWPIKPTTRYLT